MESEVAGNGARTQYSRNSIGTINEPTVTRFNQGLSRPNTPFASRALVMKKQIIDAAVAGNRSLIQDTSAPPALKAILMKTLEQLIEDLGGREARFGCWRRAIPISSP